MIKSKKKLQVAGEALEDATTPLLAAFKHMRENKHSYYEREFELIQHIHCAAFEEVSLWS